MNREGEGHLHMQITTTGKGAREEGKEEEKGGTHDNFFPTYILQLAQNAVLQNSHHVIRSGCLQNIMGKVYVIPAPPNGDMRH